MTPIFSIVGGRRNKEMTRALARHKRPSVSRRRPQHYKQEKLVERSSDFDGEEIIDSEIAKMDTPYYNLIPPLAQSEEFEPMSPGNLTKN